MTEYKPPRPTRKVKFLQALEASMLRKLNRSAKRRGIVKVQELLRAVVIPEWLMDQKAHKAKVRKKSHPRHASR